MEILREKIEKCKTCGKNRFWYFPEYNGVEGFLGEKTYIFVCSQPHEGVFNPESIFGDKCLYQCMKKYRFTNSHLTDLVKCRGPKGKELEKTEINNCIKWLRKEIELVNPKAIIAVGKKSYTGLMQEGIRPVIMINHYSTAMYDKEYEREFEALREYINAGRIRHGTKIPEIIKEKDRQQAIHAVEQSLHSKYLSEIDRLRKTEVITQKDFFELREKWTDDDAAFHMQKLKDIEKTHLSQK
jgi:uracil-DNA glycosylase family 4